MLKSTASTGGQIVLSGRQLSCAEIGAVYAWIVGGRAGNGVTAVMDSSTIERLD
jgi:hypothetical protein